MSDIQKQYDLIGSSIDQIISERNEYRHQADNYATVIAGHEERIAELKADLAKLTIYRDQWKSAAQKLLKGIGPARRLVTTQCTPDGVLVVLGETTLYTTAMHKAGYGEPVAWCVPDKLELSDGRLLVRGTWSDSGSLNRYEVLPLDLCYGSEAALTEGEKR